MTHPVLAATTTIDQALKSVADVSPTFMDTADKATALRELVVLESRVAELRLRILADADDLATETAARDAAAWLAHHTHTPGADARADLRLGQALDRRTEAHRWHPWTQGGNTDLADGVLLCSHHHHRAHDPTHRAERLPNGDVRFHRRR